jgi:hypothetical protein
VEGLLGGRLFWFLGRLVRFAASSGWAGPRVQGKFFKALRFTYPSYLRTMTRKYFTCPSCHENSYVKTFAPDRVAVRQAMEKAATLFNEYKL